MSWLQITPFLTYKIFLVLTARRIKEDTQMFKNPYGTDGSKYEGTHIHVCSYVCRGRKTASTFCLRQNLAVPDLYQVSQASGPASPNSKHLPACCTDHATYHSHHLALEVSSTVSQLKSACSQDFTNWVNSPVTVNVDSSLIKRLNPTLPYPFWESAGLTAVLTNRTSWKWPEVLKVGVKNWSVFLSSLHCPLWNIHCHITRTREHHYGEALKLSSAGVWGLNACKKKNPSVKERPGLQGGAVSSLW